MIAMEEVRDDDEADELTCAICLLTYDKPRMLACHHCFCTACLRALLSGAAKKGQVATCPLCRCAIATRDVSDLPIADKLQRQVLSLERPPEPSAPPSEVAPSSAYVADSYTKRKQPGFFDKLLSTRHVTTLTAEGRDLQSRLRIESDQFFFFKTAPKPCATEPRLQCQRTKCWHWCATG